MKKVLVSIVALIVLAACAPHYEYYHGDFRYTQDGKNCVFYSDEAGKRFSEDVRNMEMDRKIVYKNTQCSELYNRDFGGRGINANNVARGAGAGGANATAYTMPEFIVPHSNTSRSAMAHKYVLIPVM